MICIYLVFFQFGPGPVMWLYNAEIATGASLTLATAINWCTNCVLALIFPILTKENLYPMFFAFAVVSLLATIFAMCILKETKGLNSEELANLYAPEGYKTKSVGRADEDSEVIRIEGDY